MEHNHQCELTGGFTPNSKQTDFIARHVRSILTEKGYHHSTVERGVQEAIRTYQHEGNFPRGKVFDACLTAALRLIRPIKIKDKKSLEKTTKKSQSKSNKAA